MAKSQKPVEPKPFFWIPFHESPQRAKLTARESHECFQALSGRIGFEVRVVSEYLYVGSGAILLDDKVGAYYAFTRRGDQLVIPGTGIKGAVRSIVEALSNSCVRQIASKDRLRKPSYRACGNVKQGQEKQAVLCPACRLFGTTGYRGRVYFVDALPADQLKTQIIKIADLWPPRQTKGRKFYQSKIFQHLDDKPEKSHRFVEVIPKGVSFGTTLFFENTGPDEMGLLLRALGLERYSEQDNIIPTFPVKLGGAKPRCLGAVHFYPQNLYLLPNSSRGLFQALAQGGESYSVKETLEEWLQDQTLLDPEAWAQFHQGAQISQEFCPKEVY